MLDKIKKNINFDRVPKHVAIIMDGNGRWAKQSGKIRIQGHKQGLNSVKEVIEAAGELSIKYLTLYVFSLENWDRPKDETSFLMNLLLNTLEKEADKLLKNDIALRFIGDKNKIPPEILRQLRKIESTNINKGALTVSLAISYGGKWDIVNACKKIILKNIPVTEITEECVEKELSTANVPPPELLIRTGGEFRISNFLLWQLAYSELYFTPIYWPDFKKENFYQAIEAYQKRERRFGKTSDQIM